MKKLSKREMEVLLGVVEGLTSRQIGEVLGISERTVETHREHIYVKLGVKGVAKLVRYAVREGLVKLKP